MLDFSKAFDLINHHILLEKLTNSGLPRHIVRWIGAFLLDRRQKVVLDLVALMEGCHRVHCLARNVFFIVH